MNIEIENPIQTVAVFGLGIIGGIWAKHYDAAGVLTASWNRTKKSDAPKFNENILAAAQSAQMLQIVVADPAAVETILKNIRPALKAGKLVVQSSTIDSDSSEKFSRLVEETGALYLEAPFTGSKPAAEKKKNVFFLGGPKSTIDLALPILSYISEIRETVGTYRQAASIKLAMNLNIAGLMQSLVESLTFARAAGISDEIYFKILQSNVGYSQLAALKEPKLRQKDFSPQFSVKHLLKDVRLALKASKIKLPGAATNESCLQAVADEGFAEEDFAAVMRLFQK